MKKTYSMVATMSDGREIPNFYSDWKSADRCYCDVVFRITYKMGNVVQVDLYEETKEYKKLLRSCKRK